MCVLSGGGGRGEGRGGWRTGLGRGGFWIGFFEVYVYVWLVESKSRNESISLTLYKRNLKNGNGKQIIRDQIIVVNNK